LQRVEVEGVEIDLAASRVFCKPVAEQFLDLAVAFLALERDARLDLLSDLGHARLCVEQCEAAHAARMLRGSRPECAR